MEFLDDLSNWYIRRSRRRFQRIEDKFDHKEASSVLFFVLSETLKLTAPFIPFSSEAMYKQLTGKGSVHLENWPKEEKKTIDKKLIESMTEARNLVSLVLAKRAEKQIKVKQPLQKVKVKNEKLKGVKDVLDLVKDEINVKEIVFDGKIKNEIELDTNITPALKIEGQLRELIRLIQGLRQEAGYNPKDKIELWLEASAGVEAAISGNIGEFKGGIGAENVIFSRTPKFDMEIESRIDDQKIWLAIKKI